MPLGAATSPPVGYLVFCETSPGECAQPGAAPEVLTEVRAWASAARWMRTFAEAGIPLEPQGAPDLTPRTPSASTGADVETATREAHAVAKRAALKAGPRGLLQTKRKPDPVRRLVTQRDLEAVNRQVNRAIRRSSDETVFGQADVWAIPEGPRARGDCEDYALAKRRALIAMGVSPDDLSLAIVRTRAGEVHAVLLARTSEGELVLDNLSPWVVRWDSTPYEWLERQVPGSATEWVRVGTAAA